MLYLPVGFTLCSFLFLMCSCFSSKRQRYSLHIAGEPSSAQRFLKHYSVQKLLYWVKKFLYLFCFWGMPFIFVLQKHNFAWCKISTTTKFCWGAHAMLSSICAFGDLLLFWIFLKLLSILNFLLLIFILYFFIDLFQFFLLLICLFYLFKFLLLIISHFLLLFILHVFFIIICFIVFLTFFYY